MTATRDPGQAAADQLAAMLANARNQQTPGPHNVIAAAGRQFHRDADELGDRPAIHFLTTALGLR